MACLAALAVIHGTAAVPVPMQGVEAGAYERIPLAPIAEHRLGDDLTLRLDERGRAEILVDGRPLFQLDPVLRSRGDRPWHSPERVEGFEQIRWPWFHVDGIAFWSVRAPASRGPRPVGLQVHSATPFEIVEREILPHRSVGHAEPMLLRVPQFVLQRADGSRAYVAVVRVDGGEFMPFADREVWSLGETNRPRWPLAIVVAPSEEILWHDIGQALLVGELAAERGLSRAALPPMCAHCREPGAVATTLAAEGDGATLRVAVTASDAPTHGRPSFETLEVAGLALAGDLVDLSDDRASFALDLASPRATQLVLALRDASMRLHARSVAGVRLRLDPVEIRLAPELAESADAAAREAAEDELPRHLDPRLITSFPNPFHAQTRVRVIVPGTLGEAFELDDAQRARLDLRAEAPFGENPLVRVRVFNVQGQLVRTLGEEVRPVGEYEFHWNGADEDGRPVAAGAYYLNLELGDYTVTRRVTRLKP